MIKITNKIKIALKAILDLKMGEIKTDKAVLIFDGEEYAVGTEVFIQGEGEEVIAAEDGEYALEDGRIIVIAEGKIAEIKDAEKPAEEEEAPVAAAAENPIDEPAADPADAPEDEPAAPSDEDRIAALEERVNAFSDGLKQIINAIADFENRVAELEEKLNKVENTPAADPANEPEPEEMHKTRLSYLRK